MPSRRKAPLRVYAVSASDLLIVGGGIAGLCTALAAAEQGLRVTVIDSPRAGAASRAAAGMLAPTVEGLPRDALAAAIEARDAYPDFLASLETRTGVRVPLDRSGIIELATSDAELERLAARRPATASLLLRRDLGALENALSGHAGALLHPDDGAVDNVVLMLALELATADDPHITRQIGIADDIVVSRDGVIVDVAGERHAGAFGLLATGAWAGDGALLARALPRPLPVRPVRGQLLRLDARPLHHVVYGGGGYLVPRGDSIVVGATTEHAGFDSMTTAVGLQTLRTIASQTIAELASVSVIDHWAGLRPVSPDGLPILGADPDQPRLLYACGFSRNGILFAPWAARQLAMLAASEPTPPTLDSFSVARFAQIS